MSRKQTPKPAETSGPQVASGAVVTQTGSARTGGKVAKREHYGPYTRDEVLSILGDMLDRGADYETIVEHLNRFPGVEVTNVHLRGLVSRALRKRTAPRLVYAYGREATLQGELCQSHPQLRRVSVVETAATRDIGQEGARVLAQQLCELAASQRDEVHIGFMGGHTPGALIRACAELFAGLDDRKGRYPKRLVFHSLVGLLASDSSRNYLMDPNFSIVHLANERRALEANGFVIGSSVVPVPGVVTAPVFEQLRQCGLIEPPESILDRLQVIVLSAGHWPKPDGSDKGIEHNSLYDYLDRACGVRDDLKDAWEKTKAIFRDRGVIGDFGGCFVTADGPLPNDVKPPLRATTLLSVKDMRDFKAKGKAVLLLVGPCSGPKCLDSKGVLLQSILKMTDSPVTHLVADTRTTRDYLNLLRRS